MGIIVKNGDDIIYYLKGADSVMHSKFIPFDANYMMEASSDLASEGLRTLAISKKNLSLEGTLHLM